ncbi:MAG: restriction endonuclease subunit S [Lentimicrobiaceae bacterium]|jgi:type I restriction enzyme S subunit
MSDWIKTSLDEIITIVGGGTPKTDVKTFWNGSIPWISVVDFGNDLRWIIHTDKSITKEGLENSSTKLLNENDIIISARGTVGEIAQLKTPMAFNQSCYGIKAKQSIVNVDFLYFLLKHSIDKLKKNTHGSVFQTITQNTFKDIEVLIPKDILEQNQIASTLNCLDKKIENLKQQNQLLENIAQTLFNHWFIDFEFPDTNGKPYKSSGGKMIDSEMGQIPKGWKDGSFGSIAETVGGGTPSTNEESYWQYGDIQWYSPTDLTKSNQLFSLSSGNKISRLGLQKSSAKLFPSHSIMLTSRATVGEISINSSEASTNQGFITIIPNSRFTLPFLLGYVKYNLPIIKSLASGSTFPEISKTNFRNIGLFIPTDEIINTFTKASMPLLMKIESNIKTIQKLKIFNAILLPKLMSGQLRIKE